MKRLFWDEGSLDDDLTVSTPPPAAPPPVLPAHCFTGLSHSKHKYSMPAAELRGAFTAPPCVKYSAPAPFFLEEQEPDMVERAYWLDRNCALLSSVESSRVEKMVHSMQEQIWGSLVGVVSAWAHAAQSGR
jgi:hypothetical protein